MTDKPYFTVFTPVFNAEKYLHRVFQSIVQQTFKDFEWIIIDDGSTDKSDSLIQDFISAHKDIDIKYFRQEKAGKHVAWNKGVTMGKGTIFVPADADDSFEPEALSFFYEKWNNFSNTERSELSGINVLCYDNDSDKIVGTLFPGDGFKTNNLELEYRYKLKGEKWGCIRLDILKKRLFPIIKNSHYPESYLWLYFAKHYKVVCFNKPLRRYYTTMTGIIQSEKRVKTVSNAKVILSYDTWFLRNFGFYTARFYPHHIVELTRGIVSSLLVIAAWYLKYPFVDHS